MTEPFLEWASTVSCRHRWSDPKYRYASKVEYSEPDATGFMKGTLTDTREGQRCLRCGVMRADICDFAVAS